MPPPLIVYHEDYLIDYYTSTVECPARVKTILSKLRHRFPIVRPRPAERQDVLRVHVPALVDRVRAEGEDIYCAALTAAGGALRASEKALGGTPAFAPVRPPGHHACATRYWGFCFFNNVAIAITRLMSLGTIATAVVLDLDLHYGDGTEAIFRHSEAVRVVNVQADTRTSYLDTIEQELDSSNEVDVLAVSVGFDTYIRDWGGILHTEDYHTIGRMLMRGAKRFSQGRCFAVLEGGYYLPELGRNVLSFCEGLAEV